MPRVIQDILDDAFFKYMLMIDDKLVKKHDDIVRKFLQDVVHFLLSNSNLNQGIFEELMRV